MSALWRELNRIVEQVPEDLLEADVTSQDIADRVLDDKTKRYSLRFSDWLHSHDYGLDDFRHQQQLQIEFDHARNNAAEVEQFFNDRNLGARVSLDDLHGRFNDLRIIAPSLDQFCPTQNRSERRSQFMTEGLNELV